MKNSSIFQTVLLIVLGGAFVVAVLIFAGVLPGFRSQQAGSEPVITFWSTIDKDRIANLISEINKKAVGSYQLKYVQANPDSLNNDLLEALAAGTGPDLVLMPHELIFQNRNKIYQLPFTSYSERQYQDAFVDGGQLFKMSKGWLALPVAIDPLVLYYNKDLYTNAGLITPPTSWEEFVTNQPKLTIIDETKRLNQSAIALGTANNINNFKNIISLLFLQVGTLPIYMLDDKYQSGLVGSNRSQNLDSPKLALDFYNQFSDPTRSTYCWNRSLPLDREFFLAGNLANYFGLASELAYFLEKNPHLNFDVANVPRLNKGANLTFGRLYGLMVIKNSAKANLAFSAMSELALVNHENKELNELLNLPPVQRSVLAQKPSNPFTQVFYNEALTARAWPDPQADETKKTIKTLIDNSTSGRLSSDAAVTQANDNLQVIINNSK